MRKVRIGEIHGLLIKEWYPLWLNRGGLEILNSHSTVIVSPSVINSAVKHPDRVVFIIYGKFKL